MKIFTKSILAVVAMVTMVSAAFAGGPMTNTNQSAHFLRSVARGTSLSTDAVYTNPAGVVFMDNGFHIGISDQMAAQTRTITSTFAPFAMNGGSDTKQYKGEVFSPFIPSLHFAWKHNRWAVLAGIGVNGGGGSLKFDNGLASFERQFAVLPGAINQLGGSMGLSASAYDMNMSLTGKSMTLAFNVGAAFRITDWLSVAAQLRIGVTNNSYVGEIGNIQINPSMPNMGLNGQMMNASEFFTLAGQMLSQVNPTLADMVAPLAAQTADHTLDVKQKGVSVSPIIALAFHKGQWDASIKYEFKMATELEIESAPVSAKDPVINSIFADGTKVKAETPALLALAVSRNCGPVKITAQWHHYFDKDAQNSFSPVIEGNTNEYMLGVEWSITDRLLVSAGTQRTQLNMNEDAYSDMNFSISSWSVGIGMAYRFCEAVCLNVGYMPTIYDKVTSKGMVSVLQGAVEIPYTDVYQRTSHAWGIGLDLKFGGKKN
jgi:long-chain fatty acid transport protein